jgi:long-chain acyl-CoA synthetase
MEKIWLKHYQAGVPVDIDPDQYRSLNDVLEETCQKYTMRPAFANMGKVINFTELEEKSRAFAAYLQVILGMKKGERIALMMPNLLQYPIALFGALRAGLIVVNVNPLYTARELEYQLKDSSCKAIVVLANFAHTLEKILSNTTLKHVIVTEVGDMLSPLKSYLVNWAVKYIKQMVPAWSIKYHIPFKRVINVGKKLVYRKPIMDSEDIAFLQYTGGTTGIVKGAMLSHRNIIANMLQATAWISPVIEKGQEIIITALPLYHIFSLLANCLTFMYIGSLNVLVTNPRDMKNFISVMKRYPFSAITGVNTLFNALLHQERFAHIDFSHLKLSLGGGMAVQHAVADRWKAMTGTVLLEAYGLTEASPAVCINPVNLENYNGSIGFPVSSTEISIRDEQEQELGINKKGELWVRGPQVMKGYWQRPEETKITLRDGWLKTGDIATVDEQGFVRIVDRKKDMILISGFNVYPNEVEDVIAMMEAVKEVAVVGVPAEGGEKVKAFIVKDEPSLTSEQVIQYCQTQLTPYKVPKEIEFTTELPKTNVGKILRRELREKEQERERTKDKKREKDKKY